jgi:hypothetical protein
MMLYSLKEPGIPIYQCSLFDPSRSRLKRSQTRISEVCGISVSGTEILLADDHADRIVVVTVGEAYEGPCLEVHGYGRIGNRLHEDGAYHGRMAMFGSYAVVANESNSTGWIFNVEGNLYNNNLLDLRKGNYFTEDDLRDIDRDEENSHMYNGREIAVGKICSPGYGGNALKRKEQKFEFRIESSNMSSTKYGEQEGEEGLGEGGPIALATRGRWVVAGFSNGSIVRASLLPDQYTPSGKSQRSEPTSSNTLASCCYLPTDEWRIPELECDL